MKICILGNTGKNIDKSYSWFVKTVNQGMRMNGCEVMGFDYKSHNISQIEVFLMENEFDVVFTHLTFHKHHKLDDILGVFDAVRSYFDTKIIHTMQDAREEPRHKGDISNFFDLALVNQTENIKKFQKYWNIPVYYWPYSSMTYTSIGEYDKLLDFGMPVFPGGEFTHEDRSRFIKMLKEKIPIKLIGTKSREDIRDKTQNFSISSPCVLNLSTRYNWKIGGYIDVRPWQYGGAGAIMIVRPHKEQHKLIPPKLYYTINNYNQTGVKQVISHWERIKRLSDTKKQKIREDIFNFIQQKHSSYVRMKQTLELIQDKREKLDLFL